MSLASKITDLATRIGNECKTLWTAVGGKQETLVSATNIKTINSESLLGSGDLVVGSSGDKNIDGGTWDSVYLPSQDINGGSL